MSKETLENRMYTAEEVEEIVEKKLAYSRKNIRENAIKFGRKIEREGIFNAMVELDVSVNLIDKVFNEEGKEPAFDLEYIREQKYHYWRQQDKKFQ